MDRNQNSGDVKRLNSFLRGEMSAVETYNQAIRKLGSEPSVSSKLEGARNSHQQRVALLREEIVRRGGEPAEGSGVWGAFANLTEGGAKMLGKQAAIAALEQGEDHGRDDYKRELAELSPDARQLVETRILPEQMRTHDTLSELKKQV
jgi:hypothetical protein